jgi:16S rRNA (guanine966-N2)-methyltransferase
MRILKGKLAGRSLVSPGRNVRPTAESVRDRGLEAMGEDLTKARFLDLFAGAGGVGLEAISRGARSADFVENGGPALHSLKANVAAMRIGKKARVFKKDVVPWIERLGPDSYDIAWVDPPYGSRKLDRVIQKWKRDAFARILILEHDREHDLPITGEHIDFEGPTRITIVRAEPSPE